jgi:hypothetical protein
MPARAYGRSNAHGDRTSAQNFSVAPKKPTVVIQNNRQPRLDWLTVFIMDNNGQERVISLPDRIRLPRLVTINQVKLLLVCLRSLMRERRQRRSHLADNPLDGAVTGWRPVVLSTDAACFAVDVGDSSAWRL